MTGNFVFERETNGWFVVLPEWDGAHSDLEMVLGADTLCDIIAQGDNQIAITMSDEPLEGCNWALSALRPEEGGMWYNCTGASLGGSIEYDFDLWLCYVTEFVFGYLPKKIYIIA